MFIFRFNCTDNHLDYTYEYEYMVLRLQSQKYKFILHWNNNWLHKSKCICYLRITLCSCTKYNRAAEVDFGFTGVVVMMSGSHTEHKQTSCVLIWCSYLTKKTLNEIFTSWLHLYTRHFQLFTAFYTSGSEIRVCECAQLHCHTRTINLLFFGQNTSHMYNLIKPCDFLFSRSLVLWHYLFQIKTVSAYKFEWRTFWCNDLHRFWPEMISLELIILTILWTDKNSMSFQWGVNFYILSIGRTNSRCYWTKNRRVLTETDMC